MSQRKELPEETKALGSNLAKHRKTLGISQYKLAEELNIIQPLISDYERGRLQPPTDVLVRMAKILKADLNELLGLKTKINSNEWQPGLKLLRRMKKIDALPVPKQKVLLQTIDTFLKGSTI